MKKYFVLLTTIIALFLFSSCKNNSISDIYISADSSMIVGENQIIFVTNNLGTTNYDQYTFLSSNTNVATIDKNGCIHALAVGEVRITVSANGIIEGITITVNTPPIAYIKNQQAFHKDDHQTFLFSFTDNAGNYLKASGTATIKIVNSDNITVYENVHSFLDSDFSTWTTTAYGNRDSFLGCGINIMDSQILKGQTSTGTLYITIHTPNASFQEQSYAVSNLPVNASVTLKQTSGHFTRYNWKNTIVYSRAYVNNATVDFAVTHTDKLYITLTINCTCTYLDSNWENNSVGYKVHDENGNIVKTGDITMLNVAMNQSWTSDESFYLDIGTYTVVLCDTN